MGSNYTEWFILPSNRWLERQLLHQASLEMKDKHLFVLQIYISFFSDSSPKLFGGPISTENCCCSITKSCLTLWNSMDCSTPGSSVLHYLLEFAQLMSIESMMLLNHLIICCPSPFAFIPKRIHNPYSPHHLEFSPHFFVSPRFTNLSELPLLWLCIQIHCFELLPCFPEKAITKNNFKNTCIYSLVNWHTL